MEHCERAIYFSINATPCIRCPCPRSGQPTGPRGYRPGPLPCLERGWYVNASGTGRSLRHPGRQFNNSRSLSLDCPTVSLVGDHVKYEISHVVWPKYVLQSYWIHLSHPWSPMNNPVNDNSQSYSIFKMNAHILASYLGILRRNPLSTQLRTATRTVVRASCPSTVSSASRLCSAVWLWSVRTLWRLLWRQQRLCPHLLHEYRV